MPAQAVVNIGDLVIHKENTIEVLGPRVDLQAAIDGIGDERVTNLCMANYYFWQNLERQQALFTWKGAAIEQFFQYMQRIGEADFSCFSPSSLPYPGRHQEY